MIKKIFSQENLYTIFLVIILSAIIIMSADDAPVWIYQGF